MTTISAFRGVRHGQRTSLIYCSLRRTPGALVERHHSIYPRIPPQGIFFESLVERAFLAVGWPRNQVIPTAPNSPSHDLTVGATKISVKSETGLGTKPTRISITKLCTTETGEWTSEALICHALNHLARYDYILMLRAMLSPGVAYHYQLLDVPLDLLRRIDGLTAQPVGTAPRPTQLGHGRAWRRRRLVPRPLRRGRREVPDTAASGGALPNAARMGAADRRLSRRPYSHFLDLRKTSQ